MKTTCGLCGLEIARCGIKSHRNSYRCLQHQNIRYMTVNGYRRLAWREKPQVKATMVRAYTGLIKGGPGRRTKLTQQRWVPA